MYPQGIHIERLISSVRPLSCVWLFATSWTSAYQASLSITNSWSLLKLMSIESVMPSNHLILVIPFSSCLQSFPSSRSFPLSQFFTSGGQSIGVWASTSLLPINEYSGLISFRMEWLDLLAVKGLSRVFSNTTVQKHHFLSDKWRLNGGWINGGWLLTRLQRKASLVAHTMKRLPAMRETWVQSLGQEDPLEREMATQSSTPF